MKQTKKFISSKFAFIQKYILPVLTLSILVIGLIMVVILNQQPQDIRQQADVLLCPAHMSNGDTACNHNFDDKQYLCTQSGNQKILQEQNCETNSVCLGDRCQPTHEPDYCSEAWLETQTDCAEGCQWAPHVCADWSDNAESCNQQAGCEFGSGYCQGLYSGTMGFCYQGDANLDHSCSEVTGLEIVDQTCLDQDIFGFKLIWDAVPDATKYVIEAHLDDDVRPNNGISYDRTYYSTTNQYIIDDLPEGSWIIQVMAKEGCIPEENWTILEINQFCAPQCYYEYLDWDECINGWQTREAHSQPDTCSWYVHETLEELVRECTPISPILPVNPGLFLYNYEACWYGNSAGSSTYIIWDNNLFANVKYVDISPHNDFHELAHKNVEDSAQPYQGSLLVTDGTNFRWTHGNQDIFSFAPKTIYYVRLYNDNYSQVETFYMPQCAGTGGVSYKLCDENCSNDSECAANLTCYQNHCRLPSNLMSKVCASPPDMGLNRACNDYCADDRECASEYTCWWNRCRNPQNLENTSCANPVKITQTISNDNAAKGGSTYVATSSLGNCNDICDTSDDCASTLSCYHNQCRLASNLTNPECTKAVVGERRVAITSLNFITPTPTVYVVPTVQPLASSTPTISKTFNDYADENLADADNAEAASELDATEEKIKEAENEGEQEKDQNLNKKIGFWQTILAFLGVGVIIAIITIAIQIVKTNNGIK